MGEVIAFLGGMAGSPHCLGMCGIFPLGLARAGHDGIGRQLLYNLGRLNTLVAVGALAGAGGAGVLHAAPFAWTARLLALVTGLCMVLVALEMLGVFVGPSVVLGRMVRVTIARPLGAVAASRSLAAPLALGALNALLPCHLIYAFAARAAATGSVERGMLTMLAFGLGTVPAMLALGVGGVRMPPVVRLPLARIAAVAVFGFGIVTVARGFAGVTHH